MCLVSKSTKVNRVNVVNPTKAPPSYTNIRKIYLFEKVVGKGHYGVVRLASLKSEPKSKFAIKIIEKEKLKDKFYLLEREISILLKLDHPNIISFIETYQDFKYFYLVMEYCSGGELLDRIVRRNHLKEAECCEIMRKLFLAVRYIHQKKVAHRDLKPENILFSDDTPESELKIIDFGLSNFLTISTEVKNLDSSQMTFHTKVGTPFYLAPEVLKGRYSLKCDIWSLGVIMYLLLSGKLPFLSNNEAGLFQMIKKGVISFDSREWNKVSKNAKILILKLLNVNPKKRISAQQALEDPWFQSFKDKKNSVDSPGSVAGKVDINILNMLNNMKNPNKLKKEVLKVFINRLTEKEIQNIKIAFQMIDKEDTGSITSEQLMEVMRSNGFHQSEEEIYEIITKMRGSDEISNGLLLVNYTDFIAATLDSKVIFNQQKLWNLFKYFDVRNNNYITVDDLKEIIARGGRKLPLAELQKMISENENSQNGKICFEDFCLMMDVDQVQENPDVPSKRNSLTISPTGERGANKKLSSFARLKNEVIEENKEESKT